MGKHNHKAKIVRPRNITYKDKSPLFANKEIIFRSRGRAKVFNISSRAQIVFLSIVLCLAGWSFYSYHMYHKTGSIITSQNEELDQTRDAYTDLMSDFIAIHKNIGAMINSLEEKNENNQEDIDIYKQQAMVVEDRIKQIADENEWLDKDVINEKMSTSEALLQRDIAISERDLMKAKLVRMEKTVEDLKNIEMELLDKVEEVAEKEITKIKASVSTVNSTLKRKGQYYNVLSGKKGSGKGGTYIPDASVLNEDSDLRNKVEKVYNQYSDLEYYRSVIRTIPVGKPIWDYRLSSEFGHRSDPMNQKSAVHKGVDLATRKGNKISVMADGRVIKSEYMRGYGNMIEIDHGNGFSTKYAHLNKSYVKKGDRVKQNQAIGEVGNTGRSTGPHLHYEVLYRNVNVDPMGFIKAGL